MEVPKDSPSLAQLVEQIEGMLPQDTPEKALVLIRLLCKFISSDVRPRVLSTLTDTVETTPEYVLSPTNTLPATDPGASIVTQCDAFIRRLEDGHYFERMSYDEERRDERAFGDDTWAREMDELFAQAATAYFNGSYELAALLYRRLLGAFRHQSREGVFCGAEQPQEMVQTDTGEAKRRYLRAQFIVNDTPNRATQLLSELERLSGVGRDDMSLSDIMEPGPDGDDALPIHELLPSWISALHAASLENRSWSREAQRLLREAVELQSGADGLGRLARSAREKHPLAWHAWVGALIESGRTDEAIAAAREGIVMVRDETYRARLADRLAGLAALKMDDEITLEGTLSAWRAQPTNVRLLHLIAASDALQRTSRILEREATAALRSEWNYSEALACRLLLLVGKVDQAMRRFQNADALGWGRPDHAGSVVLPWILLAITSFAEPPENSALDTLWTGLDAAERTYLDRRLLLDRIEMTGPVQTILDSPRPYSELLLEAVQTYGNKVRGSERVLDAVQLKVESAVRDILASHNRRGQILAATMTAALAETIAIQRTEADGMVVLRRLRKNWSRFSAYVDALESAREASPVLPSKVVTASEEPTQDWGHADEPTQPG